MLILCLFNMPYGYYQIVRFFASAVFVFLGIKYFHSGKENLSYLYFLLALLFQPIFKIALGRELWNIIDVAVAIFLIATILKTKNKKLPK
jgi:hypothetical protein